MLQVENVPKDSVMRFDKAGGNYPLYQHSFPERYKEAYLLEMDTFLDLVLDPSLPCSVSKEDVLLSTRVADACETSIREGRVVTFDSM